MWIILNIILCFVNPLMEWGLHLFALFLKNDSENKSSISGIKFCTIWDVLMNSSLFFVYPVFDNEDAGLMCNPSGVQVSVHGEGCSGVGCMTLVIART